MFKFGDKVKIVNHSEHLNDLEGVIVNELSNNEFDVKICQISILIIKISAKNLILI